MSDKLEVSQEIAEFLSYKVRSGQLTMEASEKIWRIAVNNVGKKNQIIDILDMELPEADTVMRIERLV